MREQVNYEARTNQIERLGPSFYLPPILKPCKGSAFGYLNLLDIDHAIASSVKASLPARQLLKSHCSLSLSLSLSVSLFDQKGNLVLSSKLPAAGTN